MIIAGMATDNVEPDLEFDGYVHSPLGPRIPCNVQLWLPEGPEQEGSVSVFLNGPADAVVGHGFVRISSNERVEELRLKFAAEDVHVRSAKSQPGYRLGGSQLNIDHVDRWVIHHIRRPAESGDPVINHVQISLSPLNYGGPPDCTHSEPYWNACEKKTGASKIAAVRYGPRTCSDLGAGSALELEVCRRKRDRSSYSGF